ncbi:3-dehydroquinate dehydratase [bacterium BMS3Abin07]|nr:3-dehydroquinate dehydratase [bacterium BMS3Abin07]GBE32030.1 3-dehydroquinate dehydratase [bacterium BMS3Bbin05]HDL20577.1 type I 3-dehydroquinate dehydratase [Nitrospirota bacterium]HDO22296.1 type I 3-dehydroquinate dehydratase [Nitrospirota bacterium]HDZ88715.1 type I 3-dehydroquinate dehydratase [Nitrospirota bacterium]
MIKLHMQNLNIGNITVGKYPLIAVPLTDAEVISATDVSGTDIIELRVDMFRNQTVDYVKDIFIRARENLKKPIIATIRSESEGGAVPISDRDRKSIFKSIIDLTDAVDIEIRSEIYGSIVNLARKHRKPSIGSFHDFNATPSSKELSEIVKRGKSFRADIVKIAVMPDGPDDLRTITDITLKFHDQGIITISMGELGMTSRIYLPFIGSLLTFATLDVTTAPGQISLEKMKEFFSVLREDEH